MAYYYVLLTCKGSYEFEIEASSKDEAIDKAIDRLCDSPEDYIKITPDVLTYGDNDEVIML